MVRSLLALREIPRTDAAADGLAIAVTHAFSSPLAFPKMASGGRAD